MSARGARLHLLSAGAAKGLVESLAPAFEAEARVAIEATFDAAGTIRDAFIGGASCDVLILPAPMQEALAAQRRIDADSIAPLGAVPTSIAVPSGVPPPPVRDAGELRAALAVASRLYCPDTARSTAGIHVDAMLRALGLASDARAKLRAYPNGARAMAALAQDGAADALGCTQATEILYTPGVVLVAPLPPPFALTTVYAVAVATGAAGAAREFAARIAGGRSAAARTACGFFA